MCVCAWVAIVFNTTFDNISVISGGLVLLVEETGVPEKTADLSAQVTDNFYHIILYRVYLVRAGFQFTTSVAMGTDCK